MRTAEERLLPDGAVAPASGPLHRVRRLLRLATLSLRGALWSAFRSPARRPARPMAVHPDAVRVVRQPASRLDAASAAWCGAGRRPLPRRRRTARHRPAAGRPLSARPSGG